jgi:mRNA-degrading endonuclease toxin of MazEF toxin-antitoxin module
MQRGDIYLASFPFGDVAAMKLRPVLLLTGTVGIGTEIVVAYISSVIPAALLPSDILLDPSLPEHQGARLKAVSVLRLHKIATIHLTSLQRYVGSISTATQQTVDTALRSVLNL